MTQNYSRAPITEAVIEFRFKDLPENAKMPNLPKKLAKAYSKLEKLIEFQVNVSGNSGKAEVRSTQVGHKLTSGDGAQILSYSKNILSTSVLAPYPGWDVLISAAKFAWGETIKTSGRRPIERIGVRYINRIDVPVEGEEFTPTEYVTFGIAIPEIVYPKLFAFSMTAKTLPDSEQISVNLTTARADSPLIDHIGILLDIDVFQTVDVPQRDDDIWELLGKIRERKDAIFEASISDRTRDLIK